MAYKLIKSNKSSRIFRNPKNDKFVYLNEQVNGKVKLRAGVWKFKRIKKIPWVKEHVLVGKTKTFPDMKKAMSHFSSRYKSK